VSGVGELGHGQPMSVVAAAAAVHGGRVTAVRLIERALARIDQLNPQLTAVVAVRTEGALAAAAAVDRRVSSGGDPGALAGVPFTVKDVIVTADLPVTAGSRAVTTRHGLTAATAVTRLERAGAVLVGKTNTPEFALGIDTVNELFGRTRNPLGPFSPGGSSGGEAAAVASAMSMFGIGTDFGGSLRWPAQCTALIGLRPTVGRVPADGQLPSRVPRTGQPTLQDVTQVIGPLTTTIADSRAVLSVIAGRQLPDQGHDGDLGGIQIRWSDGAELDAHTDVAAAVRAAVSRLATAGANCQEGLPAVVWAAARLYRQLRGLDPLLDIRAAVSGREDLLGEHVAGLIRRSPRADSARHLWRQRERLRARLADWLSGDRLLALPVATIPPFMPSADGTSGPSWEILAPCRAISLFGLPAISVPFGATADGRPLSVQLVAPPYREDLLFSVGGLLTGRASPLAAVHVAGPQVEGPSQTAVQPPSTGMTAPLKNDASGEQRK
jgi:amidase